MSSSSLHLYRGYSSFEYLSTKNFGVYDVKLVELDLLNFIFTPVGTRLRLPHYGTRLKELLFQPMTDTTVNDVQTELKKAFAYDPRIELVDLTFSVNIQNHSITATCVLFYIELNETVPLVLNLQFDQ